MSLKIEGIGPIVPVKVAAQFLEFESIKTDADFMEYMVRNYNQMIYSDRSAALIKEKMYF